MGLRVHRSISWIGRAEDATDDDARFIFLWIGFNAAYADEEEFHNAAPRERAAFAAYFRKVVALDPGQQVYDAIWNNFSVPIRVLLHNRFVFNPFGSTTTVSAGTRTGRNDSGPRSVDSREPCGRGIPSRS